MKRYSKRFKLASRYKESSKLWYWVMIYPDIESLREDARDYSREIGTKESFDDCWGLCTPYTRLVLEEGKPERQFENIGIIRLSAPNISTTVMAHEILHATLWLYRVENGFKANFGKGVTDKEERLCHLYGELFSQMNRLLYRHGQWK